MFFNISFPLGTKAACQKPSADFYEKKQPYSRITYLSPFQLAVVLSKSRFAPYDMDKEALLLKH
jgi:hypothetical protein